MKDSSIEHSVNLSNSSKKYYVKKRNIESIPSKSPKQFFKELCKGKQIYLENQYNPENLNKISRQSSWAQKSSIIQNYSTIDPCTIRKNNSNYLTLDSGILEKNNSILSSLVQSQIQIEDNKKHMLSRQSSDGSLFKSQNPRTKKKKYVFQTICDSNFGKKLNRKQILIQDDQSYTLLSQINLPSLNKNQTQNQKQSTTQSKNRCRMSKLMQSRSKYERMLQKQPFYSIQKQLLDKFSMQKLKKYRKIWLKSQSNRNPLVSGINQSKTYASLTYNKSLLEKSPQKAATIVEKNNRDAQERFERSDWKQQLRGNRKKVVRIGSPVDQIQGLKGKGQIKGLNVQIRAMFGGKYNNIMSEEVYKLHQSNKCK